MALMVCGECGNQVSDKAAACPKCGAPVLLAPSPVAVVQPKDASAVPAQVTQFGEQAPPRFDVMTGQPLVPSAAAQAGPPPTNNSPPSISPGGHSPATPQLPPYVPVVPPLEVRVFGVLLGLFLLGAGAFMLFDFIPAHDPANLTLGSAWRAAVGETWQFKPEIVSSMKLLAWALCLGGVLQLVTGSTRRSGKLVFCPRCNLQTIARPGGFGWKCERCQNPA